MKSQEQLQEQYEDAYFALLMAEFARSEGKSAWEENERLKKDPNAEVPKEVDVRCQKAIRRHFAKQTAQKVGRITFKAFKHVAAIVGIAAILFISAFAASETVRVNTMNLIIDVLGESTDLHIGSRQNESVPIIKVGWLPDGYILEEQGESNISTWYQYRKSESELILIECTKSNGTVLSIDTEGAAVEYLNIQGSQAILADKDGELQLVWTTSNKMAFLSLIGEGVQKDDLIRVAIDLKY